jgi:hypothetical protein
MWRSLRRLCPCLCLLLGFSGQAQTTPKPFQVLNGNWLITPLEEPSAPTPGFQSFLFTMAIRGEHIYGSGQLNFGCGDNSGLEIEGKALADGSFLFANTTSRPGVPSASFEIRGNPRGDGAAEWRGRFTSSFTGQVGKCVSDSGEVIIKKLPPVTGTFQGSIRSDRDGAKSGVLMEVVQGRSVSTMSTPFGVQHCVPVDVRLTLEGESGPFVGDFLRSELPCNNVISGNVFTQVLRNSDGGMLNLTAWLDYSMGTAEIRSLMLTYWMKGQGGAVQSVHGSGSVRRQQASEQAQSF